MNFQKACFAILVSVSCFGLELRHAPVCYTAGDLEIVHSEGKNFADWTDDDHKDAYEKLQRISRHFEHFVVVGTDGEDGFAWHAMGVDGYLQQVSATVMFTVGGSANDQDGSVMLQSVDFAEVDRPEYDPFVDSDVIERQQVCEGNLVRVLYNYAPLVNPHLLLIPKEWRGDFRTLEEEEFLEICQLASVVMKNLDGTTYLFFKNGKPAGQSVPHFHMHLASPESESQAFWANMRILKNILIGPSILSSDELADRVDASVTLLTE